MTDLLLKEQHQNDEEHAQEEQAHRKLGSLRQRLFKFFLTRHRNETFLHTLLEDRVLSEINALEGRDQRSNSGTEQTGRQNHHEGIAERYAHLFNHDIHGGRSSRDRRSGNSDLGSHHSRSQRLRGTNTILLSHFLNDVQNGHRGKARTGENRQRKGDCRSEDIDVLRITAQNMRSDTNHIVHTASDVHHRACKKHTHDDQNHVKRHRSGRDTENKNGDRHTEAASHTYTDSTQFSRVDNNGKKKNKM